jgi:hypothetical protein
VHLKQESGKELYPARTIIRGYATINGERRLMREARG